MEREASWPWSGSLADPRGWVAAGDDPAARWLLLTGVLDRAADDPEVVEARRSMLADPATGDLVDRLDPWDSGRPISGHDQPAFQPNLLTLLADRGLRAGDDARVDLVLDQMLAHQDAAGRFTGFAANRRGAEPVWGALLCDTHAVVEVLLRYGRGSDPRVRAALRAMASDLSDTPQGPAWSCRPHPVTGFRGPGRIGDVCPQVTLEALRAFSYLGRAERPAAVLDAARTSLAVWRRRGEQKPYMFGHGKAFKTTKWPTTWYGAHAVVDTLGRYPELWRSPAAVADRRSLAEVAACLIAYNTDGDGRVVPRSVYRGFQDHSFGRKKRASPFATAALLAVLHRVEELAPDVRAVDVTALASSKGGTGRVVPPPLAGATGRSARPA